MNALGRFAAAGVIAAGVGFVPAIASAQGSVTRDTVITVHKDTVVHTREDTAVVTTRVTSSNEPMRGMSIGAALSRMPNYKTMTALLEEANLMPSLRGAAPVTLFAPTDDAWASMSPEDMAALKADAPRLKKMLLNMMVPAKIDTREILKLKTATTMRGTRIRFTYKNGRPEVNDQAITQPGIMGSNGFIYGMSGIIGM